MTGDVAVVEGQETREREAEILGALKRQAYERTDRLFGWLLAVEWLAGILVAVYVSPQTWHGSHSSVHIHVWSAVLLGGLIVARPLWLIYRQPGKTSTRQAVALGQMFYSALLIHLTGGRVESHFHIFGSLAFLAFYRDWRVLVTASLVVIFDHVLRGIVYPESIYGVSAVQPWRWVEHAWWVLFEDIFLLSAIRSTSKELESVASRQAELEVTRSHVEELVDIKTAELSGRERQIKIQFAITRLLFEARTFAEVAPELLRVLAREIIPSGLEYRVLAKGAGGEVIAAVTEGEAEWQTKDTAADGADKLVKVFGMPIELAGETILSIDFFCEKVFRLSEQSASLVNSLSKQISDYLSRAQIATQNQNLLNVVQSSSDAVIGTTKSGIITSWNRGAEKLLGYQASDMMGQSIEDLHPADGKAKPISLTGKEAVQNQQINDAVLETRSGRPVEVSLTVDKTVDENGAAIGKSFIIHDITDRKLAERRVAEFYSVVSHELRTPLTSIRGALGLMEEGIVDPASEEGKEFIEVARVSTDRLIRLINEMLDLRKIEEGKMDMYFRDVPVSKLVDSSIQAVSGMAIQAGVNLVPVVLFDGSVRGDSDKITQILTNLISNAVKFSAPGSEVKIKVTQEKNSVVSFAVEDFGPGIAEEERERIFEKFHQVDSSDSRERGGTGLGLAICKAIVEQHQGTIGVDSTVGQGSTFWFELASGQGPSGQFKTV